MARPGILSETPAAVIAGRVESAMQEGRHGFTPSAPKRRAILTLKSELRQLAFERYQLQ
jgi:hypothetical protein